MISHDPSGLFKLWRYRPLCGVTYVMSLLVAAWLSINAGPAVASQAVDIPIPGPAVSGVHARGADFPVVIEEDAAFTMSEGKQFYRFGYRADVKGDTAIAGAPGPSFSVYYTPGEAHVYTRSNGVWGEQAKLTASDGSDADFFGLSVALSEDGNTALVGATAPIFSAEAKPGAVYVFTRHNGVWSEQAKLTAPDGEGSNFFGGSVAISGDTALIGAAGANVDGNQVQGAAYVFTRSNGVWSEQGKLTAADGGQLEMFGYSVALEDGTALVGAPYAAGANGAVYAFNYSGGAWHEQDKLTASDGVPGDFFGVATAVSDGTALAGAQANVDGSPGQGAAYAFTQDNGVWSEQAKLTASDGAAGDSFGGYDSGSVALDGDTALIGAANVNVAGVEQQGAAYVFVRDGGIWSEQEKLIASESAQLNRFGTSVALSNSTGLVGVPDITVGENPSQGTAYAFSLLDLSIRSNPLDFGSVLVGQSRGPLDVAVANGSLDDVTISNISAPSLSFAAAGGTCNAVPFTLVPGESCELAFSFSPTAAGDVADTVTIDSDAPGGPHTFTLQGAGSDSALEITPEVVDFGGVEVGFGGREEVTLTNTDSAVLTISAISQPDEPFERVPSIGTCGELPFDLAPFESCTLYFQYGAHELGTSSDTVEVTSSGIGSPNSFTLQGEGLLLELTADLQTLNLGETPVGETSELRSLTLTNTGDMEIFLNEVSDPGMPFTLVSDTCDLDTYRILPAGASCSLDYAFSPTAPVDFSSEAVIDIFPPADPTIFTLQGTGLGSAIDTTPNNLAAMLSPGQQETRVLEIANLGNELLEWEVTETQAVAGRILRPAGAAGLPRTVPPSGPVRELSSPAAARDAGSEQHPFPRPAGDATTITHSESLDIDGLNSAACTNESDNTNVESQYLRTFALPDFGIPAAFDVTEVTFGIRSLTSTVPVTVNLYALEGDFIYANMTLIGSLTEELAAQEFTLVTMPVTGTAPPGATLVVEVKIPDLTGIATFYPGANSLGESAPTYFAADLCGFEEPVTMEEIGAPDMHMVMTVTGIAEALECASPAWVTAGSLGGSVPAGDSQAIDITFDAGGMDAGDYGTHLCLNSNDPRRALTVVPLGLTVLEPVPDIGVAPALIDFGNTPVGASAGPVTVTVESTGTGVLEVNSISAPDSGFTLAGGSCASPPFTLEPGTSCTLDYVFTPPSEDTFNSIVTINSNADPGNFGIALTGTGGTDGGDDILFRDRFEQAEEL